MPATAASADDRTAMELGNGEDREKPRDAGGGVGLEVGAGGKATNEAVEKVFSWLHSAVNQTGYQVS
jgi:hypothetical protein